MGIAASQMEPKAAGEPYSRETVPQEVCTAADVSRSEALISGASCTATQMERRVSGRELGKATDERLGGSV